MNLDIVTSRSVWSSMLVVLEALLRVGTHRNPLARPGMRKASHYCFSVVRDTDVGKSRTVALKGSIILNQIELMLLNNVLLQQRFEHLPTEEDVVARNRRQDT